MPDEIPGCCSDEWAASNSKRARKREAAAVITGVLLSALEETGLEGRSVLDVGCGTGDLALATLGHGARSVSGFDLGAGAIANARALADERGLAERAAFEVGDGSQAALPKSDVVVLNRVVCCYPSAEGLLANTLGAAGSVFALTAPIDRGLMGLYNRIFFWLGNGWYALRAKKFRGVPSVRARPRCDRSSHRRGGLPSAGPAAPSPRVGSARLRARYRVDPVGDLETRGGNVRTDGVGRGPWEQMTSVEIQLFGRFEVMVDGRPVPAAAWRHRRAAGLVKLLALT